MSIAIRVLSPGFGMTLVSFPTNYVASEHTPCRSPSFEKTTIYSFRTPRRTPVVVVVPTLNSTT
jgi:hypothetical protein